jgi:putative ABC transport system permease protein
VKFETLLQNVRYAFRVLRRAPGFTITAVVTLAVAIGANSAVFSAIDAVLFRTLPFPDADRLVALNEVRERSTVTNMAPVRVEEWNELNSTFEAITGYYTEDVSDTTAQIPERVRRANVGPRFIQVWGVTPAMGRGFTEADHKPGAAPVVLISHRYWQRRLGSDPNFLQRRVRIVDESYAIVGVMPASFAFPDRDVELFRPTIYEPFVLNRNNGWYRGYGRLKPGATIEQARADLAVVQARLAEQYPQPDRQISPQLEPYKETAVGGVRGSLWLLFGAVSVLLLIACTNIAALLLARAARREHEMSVRLALGSSQWSVAGQLLTEVLLLSFAGALAGIAVAAAASAAFRALAPAFPRVDEIGVDGRMVLYTLLAVLVVTVLCGTLPALRSVRRTLAPALVAGARGQVSGRHALQWLFVGVQVALSVTLLAGAGLLIRSFQELWRVDPGFEPAQVLTFRVSGSFGRDFGNLAQRVGPLLETLRATPGITAAATSSPVPGVVNDRSGFQFGQGEYQLVEAPRNSVTPMLADGRVVSPEYFATLKIPLLTGEMCREPVGDSNEVMVNRTFASRYLADTSAVGLHFRAGGANAPLRIAGVVGDAREFGLDRAPVPTVYRCATAYATPALAFLVRTRSEPSAMAETVRARINALEPLRSVYDVVPLEQRMGEEYAQNRLRMFLLGAFALTALALATLGIYATLSYVVSLRRREVGLRVALGARQSNIVSQFLSTAVRVVAVACIAGLALAFLSARLLSGMLYGVSPLDPLTISGVIVLVTVVAAFAALLPALRAARVNPIVALRED